MKKSKLDYEDRQFIAYNLLGLGHSPQVGKNKLGFIVAGFGDFDPETGEFLYPLTVVNGQIAPHDVVTICRDLEEKLSVVKSNAKTRGVSARGMTRTQAQVDCAPYVSGAIHFHGGNKDSFRDGHTVIGQAVEMASDSPFNEVTERILRNNIKQGVEQTVDQHRLNAEKFFSSFNERTEDSNSCRSSDTVRQSRGSESVSCDDSYSRSSSSSYDSSSSSSSSDSGSSSSSSD